MSSTYKIRKNFEAIMMICSTLGKFLQMKFKTYGRQYAEKLVNGNPHKIHLKLKKFEGGDLVEISLGKDIRFVCKVIEEAFFNYKKPVKKALVLMNGNKYLDETNPMDKRFAKGIIAELPVEIRKLTEREALVYEL